MNDMYEQGLRTRRAVLGPEHVDRALSEATSTSAPMQQLVTEYCWGGAVWSREGLDLKTRSLLTVAMLAVLNRGQELRAHIRGAVTNGASEVELQEVLLQVAVYGGVPAGIEGFRAADEVLGALREGLS